MNIYENKYFKYKNKYINLKSQIGGDVNKEITDALIKMLTQKNFTGVYKIHVKKLKQTEDNKDKICHHYSMFSLLNFDSEKMLIKNCCSIVSNYYNQLMTMSDSDKDVTKIINDDSLLSEDRIVNMYDLSSKDNKGNNYDHSAVVIDNLIWHKFPGNKFIFAIESDDETIRNVKFIKKNQIKIKTFKVPANIFMDDTEKDEIFTITLP